MKEVRQISRSWTGGSKHLISFMESLVWTWDPTRSFGQLHDGSCLSRNLLEFRTQMNKKIKKFRASRNLTRARKGEWVVPRRTEEREDIVEGLFVGGNFGCYSLILIWSSCRRHTHSGKWALIHLLSAWLWIPNGKTSLSVAWIFRTWRDWNEFVARKCYKSGWCLLTHKNLRVVTLVQTFL